MSTNPVRGESAVRHYDRLAPSFLAHWGESPEFVDWMATRLRRHGAVGTHTRLLDVGSGPALYASHLAEHTTVPVTCLDPSEKLLAQIPDSSMLHSVRATAEDVVQGRVDLPHATYDAIVVKEAIHHVPKEQRTAVLHELARMLTPDGRLLVVMLPLAPELPLPSELIDRLARATFTPHVVAQRLAEHGLRTSLHHESFPVTMPVERWCDMLTDRYLSLLHLLDDDELADGIAEVRERYHAGHLAFRDHYLFVRAQRVLAH